MHIVPVRWRQSWLTWAVLGLLGLLMGVGCSHYRLVRIYPEAEDHLQIAQKLLGEGNYSAAAMEYEWVAQNLLDYPFAQEARLWAQTLHQLLSLQEELLTATKKLNGSMKRLTDLKQKGSSLEEDNQKLKAEIQRLKAEAQGLKAEAQGLKAETQGLQQEIQRLRESYIQLERLEKEIRHGK